MFSSNTKPTKPIIVNLNIGDQLTSISCGHVVVELIKFIAYQRLQIPYSYQWLKQVVNKRKTCEEGNRNENLQSERQFRIASASLENLDFILKSLCQEICGPAIPEEVIIALGGTPVTWKEVYRLLLPTLCHKPQCHSAHIANDEKIQRTVFRTLVTSEKLSEVFFHPIPPTNTYILIKKKLTGNQDVVLNTDNFVLTSGCRIPRSCKTVVVDFRTHHGNNLSCCNEFQVFGDIISRNFDDLQIDDKEDDELNEIESTHNMKWYQSTYIMKGFKDCLVNGTSVSNIWLQS
ncbi:uncharacterized protein LOC113226645 [Hyposmocoma kahamanoa]|uniref:uncharacterized protein LOC113226645 n=1 Tax=Hyposmocoma kahamanoa TaxID=1477025 RepID=UPI000E6D8A85|nr:uncharacterized protein LOC113226645 [Hyposmocoma kahamanoa]